MLSQEVELLKDEDFLYASLYRKDVKVIRCIMNKEVTVEVGIVRSYSEIYIKINDCYFIRSSNKFIVE